VKAAFKSMSLADWDRWQADDSVVKCRFLDCAAGTGLAGHGVCFLGGDWADPECAEFVSEEEWERTKGVTDGGIQQ